MYSLNRIIRTVSLIAPTLGCFGLSPAARAVCQEGCLTHYNTVLGEDALLNNTDYGEYNTAIGDEALRDNTTGSYNTAIGGNALVNGNGSSNTAIGFNAMRDTTGNKNTAVGGIALQGRTGSNNTAIGYFALVSLFTGDGNVALGESAGINLSNGSNNIDIGNAGAFEESGIIRIGTAGPHTATFIAGIREAPLAHGVAVGVGVTADGQLGVRASSARFKEMIKPMDKASEAIFSLQPVTFRYKKALDPKAAPQFGLVAEQVAKVSPDLVVCDAEGKPYTVRYDEVNAMLLNEFLKEHRKGEQQDVTISELKSLVEKQQEQIAALASQIRTVSNRLDLREGAPRVVASEP